jgi:hypothetical protein
MKETRLNVRSVKAAPPLVPAPPTNVTEVPTAPVADTTTTTTTTTTPPEIDLPAPASPPTTPASPPTAPASSPPTAPPASPLLMTPVASPLPEEGAPLVLPPIVDLPAPPPAVDPPVHPPAVTTPPVPPVVVIHEQEWFIDDAAIKSPQNQRANNYKAWGMRDSIGNIHGPGTDRGRHLSRLDYFLMSFPPKQLSKMIRLTNRALIAASRKQATKGELLKYFGVMILCTRYEFTSRASLWSTTAPSKYVNAAALGKTGMPRQRFDDLWRYLVWSKQPAVRPEGMSHKKHRWMLVDGFVEEYNRHRETDFIPSVLTSPSLVGTVKGDTGSTTACQCMLPLIGSRRTAARFRMHVAVGA